MFPVLFLRRRRRRLSQLLSRFFLFSFFFFFSSLSSLRQERAGKHLWPELAGTLIRISRIFLLVALLTQLAFLSFCE